MYYIVIRKDDGKGPAVTLDVLFARCHKIVLSVDLVPAVCLLEWPSPAKHWTSSWLSPGDVDAIKTPEYHGVVKPFVVPKIHPTGIVSSYAHLVFVIYKYFVLYFVSTYL